MKPRSRDFPFAHAWFHRDVYRGYGWCFGFYFAPQPGEEHMEGDMVRALAMWDGFISFNPWQFRLHLWCADPADRPVKQKVIHSGTKGVDIRR